jgi:hypothetical protein
LLENENYIQSDLRSRLAYRDFGTCLGIGCAFPPDDNSNDATTQRAHSEAIITRWEEYASSTLTPEDLKPITKVMYSTALIPGGKWPIKESVDVDLAHGFFSF